MCAGRLHVTVVTLFQQRKKSTMAYITNSNLKRIIGKIDLTKSKLEGTLFRRPIYFLSRFETQELLATKEFFLDPSKFVNEYYKKLIVKRDSQMIFNKKTTSYHSDSDCVRLNSDYSNYKIPDEILQRGDVVVEQFRLWFIQNIYLLESGEQAKVQALQERCRLKFGLKELPLLVHYENSGATCLTNNSLLEVEANIIDLLKAAGRHYYSSPKTNKILRRFSKCTFLISRDQPIYGNDTGYSEEEVREELKYYFENFKKPVIDQLKQWYRIQYNPDLNFDDNLLDQLGFEPCKGCHDNHLKIESTCNHEGINLKVA